MLGVRKSNVAPVNHHRLYLCSKNLAFAATLLRLDLAANRVFSVLMWPQEAIWLRSAYQGLLFGQGWSQADNQLMSRAYSARWLQVFLPASAESAISS
jgi:hypothetical protein